jgi:hypothetical protein
MDITHKLQHLKGKGNTNIKWIPADTEKAFLERLKKEPNNPSLQHYLQYPIEYKMNNMGFRTPVDFVEGVEGNLFLGCSHTMGIGHYLENVWSWKLNEYVGGKFLNAGVGGAGIGTGFRLFYGLKGTIRPKNVFLFFPHTYRFEYFDSSNWTTMGISSDKVNPIISEKNNMEMYYYLHYNAIKTLCDNLGANLYTLQDDKLSLDITPTNDIPISARDYHLHINQQHHIFEKFKYVYDNKLKPSSRPLEFQYSY